MVYILFQISCENGSVFLNIEQYVQLEEIYIRVDTVKNFIDDGIILTTLKIFINI